MAKLTVTYQFSEIVSEDVNPPVNVSYNNSVISTLNAGDEKTLQCNGKYMYSNVAVGSRTLQCMNKIATSNIIVKITGDAPMPVKGDLITMNLDGTDRLYRVLKIDGMQAEILAMFDPSTSVKFNSAKSTVQFTNGLWGGRYANAELDNYLNNTWYGKLTADAKAAIVPKYIEQDMWYDGNNGNPSYIEISSSGSIYTRSNANGTATVGNRNVYALSVQDVIDYLEVTPSMTEDDTIWTPQNLFRMFFNASVQPSTNPYLWLRSARANDKSSGRGWIVYSSSGFIATYSANLARSARPALTIDLSKIAWQPYTA